MESSPFTDSGEQARVQEKDLQKLFHSTYRSRTTNISSTAETSLQRLSCSILSRESLLKRLVHPKFVFTLPKDVRGDKTDLRVMASHAYSYKNFW